MDKKQLLKLVEMFKTEAKDHLAALNRNLLTLERQPQGGDLSALLEEIFRDAHSLKGAARTVGFSQTETIAHHLESVFGVARSGELELKSDICDVLYSALDAIEFLLRESSEIEEKPAEISDMLQRLEMARQGTARAAAQPVALKVEPSPEPNTQPAYNEDTIRVNINKLEALMAQASELLVFKITAEQHLSDLKKMRLDLKRRRKAWRKQLDKRRTSDPVMLLEMIDMNQNLLTDLSLRLSTLEHSLANDTLRLGLVIDNVQDNIRQARMLPFETLTGGLQRMVRDLAHKLEKQVTLEIRGENLEIDKKILEEIRDPLMHLLGNAVDHGIESAAERQAKGKPVESRLQLTFTQTGNAINIIVEDDGRGLNLEAIQLAALKAGVIHKNDLSRLTPGEIAQLILLPGISTNQQVTNVSGRGVGLDVVRHKLESLNGQVQIDTRPNEGTRFYLSVPLTLATTRGLMVRVMNETYALPLAAVVKIVTAKVSSIHHINGRESISINGKPTALVRLADLIGVTAPPTEHDLLKAVLLRSGETQVAFVVDELLGEQEMVIKNMGKQLNHVRNVAGATLLGNGDVMIILNPMELIRSAQGANHHHHTPIFVTKSQEAPTYTILVVDDSITTRTLEKNILEAAGYTVVTAMDGAEALRRLQTGHFDLVVSDIQMPQMDGFDLARNIRNSNDLNEMPLILVTSLESQSDRERGLQSGANAYIVKSGFDQADLLSTIKQLI